MHLNIEETPIQKLDWPELKNTLYIKRDDFIPFSFGGNKVRIANQFLLDMEKGPYDCMISYGQSKSNLCRVVANLCSALGMDCYIVSAMNEGETYEETANSRMLKKFGAQVITCKKTEIAQTMQALMSRLEAEGKHPYYVYGNIYGKGREAVATTAYRETYAEIHRAMERLEPFDYIFLASGTGTTQSGLIAGAQDFGDPVKIVGISVARSQEYGESGIRENLEAVGALHPDTEIHFTTDYLLGAYGNCNDGIRETVETMLVRFGIPLDTTYTGKAFWGMLQYIKEHQLEGKRILFIHTGGTPLFFDQLQ